MSCKHVMAVEKLQMEVLKSYLLNLHTFILTNDCMFALGRREMAWCKWVIRAGCGRYGICLSAVYYYTVQKHSMLLSHKFCIEYMLQHSTVPSIKNEYNDNLVAPFHIASLVRVRCDVVMVSK